MGRTVVLADVAELLTVGEAAGEAGGATAAFPLLLAPFDPLAAPRSHMDQYSSFTSYSVSKLCTPLSQSCSRKFNTSVSHDLNNGQWHTDPY